MELSTELFLLGASVLFFLSLLAGKAGSRFGVPALLLFLGVGMLCGSDGLGIHFENLKVAQYIGTVALCMILFSGGLDTKFSEILPVFGQGLILATIGVLLTALFTGIIVWWVLGKTYHSASIGFVTSLLLASTMSSTDSASVFSLLRSKGLSLKNNLRPMLEFESGSNDPMAYVLTITLIGLITMDDAPNYLAAFGILVMQLIIGLAAGYLLGKLAVIIINHIKIGNDSLYPILVFTVCIFIFSITYFIKGNSYLAVYIGGLIIGNSRFTHKRSSLNFFDGLAWLGQLILFLTLGLLVNPSELIPLVIPGLIISFAMILLTRPLSVLLCLLPFRKMHFRDKTFVSWVGLRGAVPIVFAMLPLTEAVPHSNLIFNIVFLCTLISLIVQGTTLSKVAIWLRLSRKPQTKKLEEFDVEFSDDINSITTEIIITRKTLRYGHQLMNLPFPDKTLAVLVKRDDKYFVPSGKTILQLNDKLLIITDNPEALKETYDTMDVVDIEM